MDAATIPFFERVEVVISFCLSLLHLGGALAVTWHCVLHKRESRSVAAWVGLAWLAPVFGSVAYLCLGINRIERIGAKLGIDRDSDIFRQPDLSPEDQALVEAYLEEHPTFVGMARAGGNITGRDITLPNRVEPLVNGDEAYPAMLEAIEGAERSVTLLSYIFDNDRVGRKFVEALAAARERGVEVRVLVDHVGSNYSPKPRIPKLLLDEGIPSASFLKSGQAGIFFRFANLRNHRKILVIDGEVGFTGGTNIREGHQLSLEPSFPVQCLHFRIEGPVVAQMQEVFAIDWNFTTGEALQGAPWFSAGRLEQDRIPLADDGLPRQAAARGVSEGPDDDLDKMNEILLAALSVAQRRVRIATPYFLPEDALLGALATAAQRGVEIDIVLPEKNNVRIMDWATTPLIPWLMEYGCRFHRTPAPFDHTKLMVVDEAWFLVGSTNWDPRSLRLNFEFNIECYGRVLGRELDAFLGEKIARARPVTGDEFASLPRLVRFRNGVARLLTPYL